MVTHDRDQWAQMRAFLEQKQRLDQGVFLMILYSSAVRGAGLARMSCDIPNFPNIVQQAASEQLYLFFM